MKLPILSLLAIVALVGCAQSGTPNEVTAGEGSDAFEYNSPNRILSQAAQPVSVTSMVAEDGSSLKVVFSLRNSTTSLQYAKYTMIWLDSQGAPLQGTIEIARQVTLPVGTTTFTAVATSPKAKKFKILISETL